MSITKPNLDQIGNYLNNLPPDPSSLQQLNQWSKGTNPDIPGWAAAAALQSKTNELGQQSLMQGAATGPMPTVIDKLRQQAAQVAQAKQQQDMARRMQMAQAQQPGIAGLMAPAAAPAPTEPAPSAGMTAATGGLMHLPVDSGMFNYAEGGVIGFDQGGDAKKAVESAMPVDMPASYPGTYTQYLADRAAALAAVKANNPEAAAPAYTGPRQETYAERDTRMHNQPALSSYADPFSLANITKMLGLTPATPDAVNQAHASAWGNPNLLHPVPGVMTGQGPAVAPAASNAGTVPVFDDTSATAPAPANTAPPAQTAPAAAPAQTAPAGPANTGIQQLLPKPPAAAKPVPVPAPTGPAPGSFEAQLQTQLNAAPVEPTTKDVLKQEAELMPDELKTPYMKEARARAQARDDLYKAGLKDRGVEHLMKVLNAIHTGGLAGAGVGDVNATEAERAADYAHQVEMAKTLDELDKGQRGEAQTRFTERTKSMSDKEKEFAEAQRNRTTALASAYGTQQRSADEALNRLTDLEKARIMAAVRPSEQMQAVNHYLDLKTKDPKAAADFMDAIGQISGAKTGRDSAAMEKAMTIVENSAKNNFALLKKYKDNPALKDADITAAYNKIVNAGAATTTNPTPTPSGAGWGIKPIQ